MLSVKNATLNKVSLSLSLFLLDKPKTVSVNGMCSSF